MFDDDRIVEMTAELIERVEVGTLSTVDEHGRPHSRYAAAATNNGQVHWLYALSPRSTRKIEHIRVNPAVSWLFADANYEHVATLRGQASIHSTTDLPMGAWNSLIEHAHHYAMDATSDPKHHQYDAIVTRVQEVELLVPSMKLFKPHVVNVG